MGLMLMLLLIPGTDTMATGLMPMATPTGHMAMDTIMERGLLMPSLLPMLLLLLMLPLIPGMDTTATGLMPMATPTGHMAMDTTMERGLLMLSLLLMLMLRLPLMLMPGMDTMAMPDLMAMVMPMGIPMPITDTTTARGLLMLRLLPLLMLRLL